MLPSRSGTPEVLNRNGYRLRPVLKAKLPKKVPETDAIFANVRERDRDCQDEAVMRLSMDHKATANIGDYSRGGGRGRQLARPTTTWDARKNTPAWCLRQ